MLRQPKGMKRRKTPQLHRLQQDLYLMQVLPKGLPTAQQDRRMVPTAIPYQPQSLRQGLQDRVTPLQLVLESQD